MIAHLSPVERESVLALPPPLKADAGIIVYGAGKGGREFAEHARRLRPAPRILFFCDDDPQRVGQIIDGVLVQSSAALADHRDIPVVIAFAQCQFAEKKLQAMGTPYCFSEDFDLMRDAASGGGAWENGASILTAS